MKISKLTSQKTLSLRKPSKYLEAPGIQNSRAEGAEQDQSSYEGEGGRPEPNPSHLHPKQNQVQQQRQAEDEWDRDPGPLLKSNPTSERCEVPHQDDMQDTAA